MKYKTHLQLLFWFLLQLAFITYVTLKGLDSILIATEMDKTGIMIILAAVFVIMYLKNIYDTILQKKDHDDLSFLTQHLNAQKADQNDLFGLNALPAGKIRDSMELLHSQSMIKNSQSIDLGLALESWISSIEQRYELLKHGAGIVITIGLIGTMAGLIMTMGGLEGVMMSMVKQEQSDDLLNGLSETLGGMSTAFYTTLFGAILGGAFLKTLAILTYNIGVSNIHQLSFLLQTHILPQISHEETHSLNEANHKTLIKKIDALLSQINPQQS